MIRVRFTLPQSLPVAEQGRVVSRHAPIIMSTLRGSHLPATRKGLQGGQRPLRQRGQCAQIPLPRLSEDVQTGGTATIRV